MVLKDFLSLVFSFPTNVFSIPFIVIFVIMLFDMMFGFVDDAFAEFEFSNLLEGGLLLPPVLSKVPLVIALSVSLFIATILSFYLSSWLIEIVPESANLIVYIVSIPITLYASLHIAALVLKPLQPLFCKNNAFARIEFIGLYATAKSSRIDSEIGGEAMVVHEGNEVLLNVKTEGQQVILYGEEMVIVAQEKDKTNYIVVKKQIID